MQNWWYESIIIIKILFIKIINRIFFKKFSNNLFIYYFNVNLKNKKLKKRHLISIDNKKKNLLLN